MFECKHPFLIHIDYVFQDDDRIYFIMPYVSGGELYKAIKA